MRFAAVIVTHNRREMLGRTLAKSLAEPFDHFIIVNNASSDGTAEYLGTLHDPRIQVLTLPENIGGAGGFAQGLKIAASLSVDWIVLFDDDAYPQMGALDAFRTHLPKLSNLGAIASRVETGKGERHPLNRPTRVPFLSCNSLVAWIRGTPRLPLASGPVDTVSFVGCFLRPSTFNSYGAPDQWLFIGGDDTAYSLKLRKNGLQNHYLDEVRFTHLGGAQDPSPTRAFFSARNRIFLTLDLMPWLLPFVLTRHYLRTKSRTTPTIRSEILRATRRGFIAGFKGFRAYKSGAPFPRNVRTLY